MTDADVSGAEQVEGAQVVRDGDLVAVLHERPDVAEEALSKVKASFETPEHIDDGEQTAPSKRLASLFPGYNKVLFGTRIIRDIGLQTVRSECPHFDKWLTRLEQLEPI